MGHTHCCLVRVTLSVNSISPTIPTTMTGFGRQDDEKRRKQNINQNNNGKDKRRGIDDAKEGRVVPNGLGLSRSGKHLLVSAYLASHNSRDTGKGKGKGATTTGLGLVFGTRIGKGQGLL